MQETNNHARLEEEKRWQAEQEFFDAEEYSREPLPADTVKRFAECCNPETPAEFQYVVLGDVRNKRIFEFGCGDGSNAIILALRGANVVALDISSRATACARERVEKHGLTDRITFYTMPVEQFLKQNSETFDAVTGFAILHHLLPVLDSVLTELKRLGRPGTQFVFVEPVSLSNNLRKLRLMLPLKVYATPDERPLDSADMAILKKHFPNLDVHMHLLFVRIWARFVAGRYEDYSPLAKSAYNLLCKVDRFLLNVPGLEALGGIATIRGSF